jgi:starvation-inducible outer membrane lipoprotein
MRIAFLCGSLCFIPLVGCSAMPHSISNNDTSATDQDSLRYYDETAHYDAVKNLWFGLDAPSASQGNTNAR